MEWGAGVTPLSAEFWFIITVILSLLYKFLLFLLILIIIVFSFFVFFIFFFFFIFFHFIYFYYYYRIYPKYSDTLNVRTRSFFLKRHLFYVPYISGHIPYRVFLLPVNVRTPKTCPLFLIKLLFFTT